VEVALARARADRQTARHPSHRQMLDEAIATLIEQLQRNQP
jgi:hypothetical protein